MANEASPPSAGIANRVPAAGRLIERYDMIPSLCSGDVHIEQMHKYETVGGGDGSIAVFASRQGRGDVK